MNVAKDIAFQKADFTTGISSEGNLHHRLPLLVVGDLMFWFVVVLKFQAR
jgi:hypothetical protein